MAGGHAVHRAIRHQGPDQHLCPPTGRARRTRPGRAGGPLLARVRTGRQRGHHPRHGDESPVRGDRAAPAHGLDAGHRLGSGLRTAGRRRTVVGAGHRAGLSHDHLRVHPRRGVPPRHRSHRRSIPAHRNRRTAGGRDPHRLAARPNNTVAPIGSPSRTSARCWPTSTPPATPPRWPNTRRPAWPCRWDSRRTTKSAPTIWTCGASSSSREPTGRCRRWDWRRSTTRWRRRSCSAASTWT